MKELAANTRKYREILLKDPFRPGYHFAVPDDDGLPGDPNGAFFDGEMYHLMYLYRNSSTGGFHWGHQTSLDLLHWRNHEDALAVSEGDEGCYSGGAFLDDDRTAYLTFWRFAAKDGIKDKSGIGMACSRPPYEHWERMEPIAINATQWGIKDVEINGKTVHLACADPSNIWKMNGRYYMQTGNLMVLEEYGRKEDSPAMYTGDWTELFRSDDLRHWEFLHRFYSHTAEGYDLPDRTEDDMCPSFLPLFDARENGRFTGKYLQLFIAHNRGCQYYVGTLEGETFIPETHGRMTWKDNAFFAPEALVDGKNRQIMWAWLPYNHRKEFAKYGWSGVFSFPRVLWLEEGILRMAPAKELDLLQYGHMALEPEGSELLNIPDGFSFRIKAEFNARKPGRYGLRVLESPDRSEYVEIYADTGENLLVMDVTKCGNDERNLKEEAPFDLKEGETVSLDIFVDRSIVEVYANERQAICRRAFPCRPEKSVFASLIGERSAVLKADYWKMAPTNPY